MNNRKAGHNPLVGALLDGSMSQKTTQRVPAKDSISVQPKKGVCVGDDTEATILPKLDQLWRRDLHLHKTSGRRRVFVDVFRRAPEV